MVTVTDTTGETTTYRSDERGSARGSAARGDAWAGHPVATVALRATAAVGPLLAAVAVVLGARALFPVPADLAGRAVWALVVGATATATVFLVAALLRRVLPLAALLRLSLAFPDHAPSRLRIARRTATLQQAQARVAAALVVDDTALDTADTTTAIRHCLELVASLAHHDRITRGHCERVRAYCNLIGEELGLGRDDLQRLQWAGLLHDVGKVGVPTAVLNKRGRLTPYEWEQIKQHPAIGARLTRSLEPWLGEWVRGVGEHHERWDGDGYPKGLRGTEISLAARIIAVADAFDVMTAARSYKDPLPAEAARAELVRCAGTQFDDAVVRAFVAVSIGKLRRVMGPSAALAQIPVIGSVLLAPTHRRGRSPRVGRAGDRRAHGFGGDRRGRALARGDRRDRRGHTDEHRGRRGPERRRRRPTASPPRRPAPRAPRSIRKRPPRTPRRRRRHPTTITPPTTIAGPGPIPTTTLPPGLLAPVVDPVNEDVVDPVVDVVDGLVARTRGRRHRRRHPLPPRSSSAAAEPRSPRPGTVRAVAERTDWNPILRAEFAKPYWPDLQRFVADERARHPVYPAHDEVFAALHLTPYEDVKVLILGQDPYHGAGQAHGLCFSVRPGVPAPPSLQNILKELHTDLGIEPPDHGCLEAWASQGVLLLNATLTVRARQAASHQGKGWETFTDEVIRAVNAKPERVVFILWGASARKKKALIDTSRHVIIESAHPSPLSAHNGFFGSRPFSRANEALVAAGRDPVDWRLPPR